ncbi:MAG: DUF4403 family protein [Pseudomonadales bacterium]|nr:DUF4403 family protein [Pseudomonadales bacterium]
MEIRFNPKHIMTSLIVVSIVLLTSGCKIKPPKPDEGPWVEPPPISSSILPVTIGVDVTAIRQLMESQLSTSHGPSGVFWISGHPVSGGTLQIGLHRVGGVNVDVGDNQLNWSVELAINNGRYDFEEKKAFGVKLKKHQDIGGAFRLAGNISIKALEDWTIASTTQLGYTYTENPWFNVSAGPFKTSISVGGMVSDSINSKIGEISAKVDQLIEDAANDPQNREKLDSLWRQAHRVEELSQDPSVYAVIDPVGLGLAGFSKVDDQLVIMPQIEANISFAIQDQAPNSPNIDVLPMNSSTVGQGKPFELNLPLSISNEKATALANDALGDQIVALGNSSFEIRKVDVSTLSSEALLIGVSFKAADIPGAALGLSGKLYLSGLPVFNTESKTIQIENLDFTLDTKNLLVDAAAIIADAKIVSLLEEQLIFDLSEEYSVLMTTIKDTADDKEIVDGVFLSVDVASDAVETFELLPRKSGIEVRAKVIGRARVDLKDLSILGI